MRLCVRLCLRGGRSLMPLFPIWRDPVALGLAPGTYKFDGKGALAHHRFHLRIDSRKKGVLLIDASKLLFLNGTAIDLVRCALEDKSPAETVRYMTRRYKRVEKKNVAAHYSKIRTQLSEYVAGSTEVILVAGTDNPSIGADDMPSPYRMDLALTYRCQNNCGHCYNETKDKKELTSDQWKEVLSRLWAQGIPHVVFTGGEPTLYQGLEGLIAKSEEFGQVTGLITNGRTLGRPGYLKELVRLGLDHVQITVLSHREDLHDRLAGAKGAWKETIEGLKMALAEDLYVSTNTTILRDNVSDVVETMKFLTGLGVRNIAFNVIIRSGKGESADGITFAETCEVLDRLKTVADESGVNMIWYSPTPYCEFNPITHGFGIKQCTACSINMAIEPDGTVLPCQSYYESLGNILTDPWDKIWNNTLCKDIRGRKDLDAKCADCQMKQVCGGGCPLAREYGEYLCLDRHSSM
jgi:radical SAM protein with 4Fe4S-binding SPASM domain